MHRMHHLALALATSLALSAPIAGASPIKTDDPSKSFDPTADRPVGLVHAGSGLGPFAVDSRTPATSRDVDRHAIDDLESTIQGVLTGRAPGPLGDAFRPDELSPGSRGTNRADNDVAEASVPPEPTTLVVLIACGGAGLLFRRRRRIGVDELEPYSA